MAYISPPASWISVSHGPAFEIESRKGTQQISDGKTSITKVKLLALSPPRPRNQSSPVHALMSYPDPFNAPDRLILNIQRRIRMTHEAPARKVNAITHMCWNYYVSHLLLAHDLTRESRFDQYLVAIANAVLRDTPDFPRVSIKF